MITPDFLWLILSHLAVIIPIYIGTKHNCRRWLPCNITLLTTACFSSIYHWVDQDNYNISDFEFLNQKHDVYAHMDFFGSYLSIFLTVFYTINPARKPKHLDISIILIVFTCAYVSFIICQWYIFTAIITLFSLIYIYITNQTNITKLLIHIKENKFLTFLALSFLVTAVGLQYYLAIKNSGYYYRIYHGIWHFGMFTCSGLWMLWNEKMRTEDKLQVLCFPV